MKTQLQLLAICHLLSALGVSAHAQGSLTPPGAPVATMKTLAQIEPRTPISSAPFTISVPGSYYLTTNLTTAVSNAIVITANGVTLDLNGFTIFSTVASAANGGYAVLLGSSLNDITIFNGHIRSGVTNDGSGVFSGPGFAHGISRPSGILKNTRVSGVSVTGCLDNGIYLGFSDSTVAESCTVRTVGNYGIYASVVKACVAVGCGDAAIVGNQVSDSRGDSDSDYGLFATTAQNCSGSSDTSYGLYATTAQNCSGSSTSSYGLYAVDVAIGCRGSSYSGTGLFAFIANSCRGTTSIGTGLSTTHNVNSY